MTIKHNSFGRAFLFLLALFIFSSYISGCELFDGYNTGEETVSDNDDPYEVYDPGALSTLAGTTWRWGASLLEFNAETVKFRGNNDYAYTAAMNAGTGNITGLGSFEISSDNKTLEILDYRSNSQGYNAVFRILPPGNIVIPDTIVGTEWENGSQWEIFFTSTIAINRSSQTWYVNEYTYNKEKKSGKIDFINEFEILENGEKINFLSFKNYGHPLIFVRRH
jgi:hypothetical protein